MRKAAAAAALALGIAAGGCGGTPAHPRHHHAVAPLTTPAACRRLRAGIAANGGSAGKPELRYLYLHAADRKVALLARDAAMQVSADFHTALLLLDGICSRHGVQIGAS